MNKIVVREQEWDRENERRLIPYLEKDLFPNHYAKKLTMAQMMDFAIVKSGRVEGIVEFKCWPNINIEKCNGTVFINMGKYRAITTIPFIYKKLFVWGFKNGDLYYFNVLGPKDDCYAGYYKNKFDPGHDISLVIPIKDLHKFATNEQGWVTSKDYNA